MKQRRPSLDFKGVPAAWSRDPGCAAVLNAGGVLAPAIEPYLNCVMAEAARRLDQRHAELKADIRLLIRQEGEHTRLHDAFNRALYAQGLEALEPLVDQLKRDLAAQFDGESFAFNLAWCAAFETFTLYLGQFVFGPGAHWLEGGDARAVALWRWHLAEEYEHRSVCQDAFSVVVGNYPLRLWAMARAHRQVGRYRRQALEILSRDRRPAFGRAMAADVALRMLPAFLPFHQPAKAAPCDGMAEALAGHPERA